MGTPNHFNDQKESMRSRVRKTNDGPVRQSDGPNSFTGNSHVQNRFYNGESLGAVIYFNNHNSGAWIQGKLTHGRAD